MDRVWHHMHRHFGKTNSLQIILAAITLHSLISIIMIYVHLSWYFDTDSSSANEIDQAILGKRPGIALINAEHRHNLITSEVIKSDEISHFGWWMDHAKWKSEIQCFHKKWALCSKVFSTVCKSDRIRAIYQYIPIRSDVKLTSVEISLRASADQLVEQNGEPFYGMLILVKLVNGTSETLRLQLPSDLDVWTHRQLKFSSPVEILSLTLMLTCIGYSGTVMFTDLTIIPIDENRKNLFEIGAWCSTPNRLAARRNNLIYETIELPNTNKDWQRFQITFVSQVSMDRMLILEHSLQTWTGPVSLTIFVPVRDLNEGIQDWQRTYIRKKLKHLNLTSNSQINLVAGLADDEYPINKMRNIAMSQVKTKYMFLTDADFQPSPEFEQRFVSVVSKWKYSTGNNKNLFVVPAFEYLEMPKRSETVPKTKEEFLQVVHRDDPLIQPFRVLESAEAHQLTDYWKWFYADSPYKVEAFSDKFEPYLIVEIHDHFPMFDERFTGYGMNKVTHTTELFAANYNFMVLHNVWMIHVPHKASSYSQEFLQRIKQRLKNRSERFEFITDIIDKYKIKLNFCLKNMPLIKF